MSLPAGKLDQRITLQQRAPGQDSLGQANGAWTNLAVNPTVWARAEPLRGREFFAAGQQQHELTTRFVIRYRADVEAITGGLRVLWRGVPYDVVSPAINKDGARVELELMCATGVRDGR
jgi:SPP1 family predicted phage head-tail adaptor